LLVRWHKVVLLEFLVGRPDHQLDCLWKKGHLKVLLQVRKPAKEDVRKDLLL
jgi:hypothetical protein